MKRLKKDDLVKVTKGRERGKTGRIRSINSSENRAIVADVNIVKKHMRQGTTQARQAGIVDLEAPIHISNVSPVVDGKPTRVRFETRDDGSKVRVAVRTGKVLGTLRSARK